MSFKFSTVSLRHFLFFAAFVSASIFTYKGSPTEPVYLVVAGFLGLSAFVALLAQGKPILVRSNSQLIGISACFILPLIWLYGVVLGLALGNDLSFVFRNFFGLSFYFILLLIFIIKPSLDSCFRAVVFMAFIQVFYAAYYASFAFDENYIAAYSIATSLSEFKIGYNVGSMFFVPVALVLLMYFLAPMQTQAKLPYDLSLLNRKWILYFSLFFTVYPSLSKGFILALVMGLLVVWVRASASVRLSNYYFKFSITVALLLSGILYFYFDFLFYSFSFEEQSNHLRAIQSDIILADVTFHGRGLGAVITNGGPDYKENYGLELTYHSLLHKLGVLSLFVFFFLAYPVLLACYWLAKGRHLFHSTFILSLMLYLVPGYGNPIVFNPVFILFHCTALYCCSSILGGRNADS